MYVFELYFFNGCTLLLLQGFQNLVGVIFKYLQGQKDLAGYYFPDLILLSCLHNI